jgi:hypothetical protein
MRKIAEETELSQSGHLDMVLSILSFPVDKFVVIIWNDQIFWCSDKQIEVCERQTFRKIGLFWMKR